MECKDCAMFDNRKDIDGNYICYLCSGTYVSPKEKESNVCKYTGEPITDEYASKKFWMSPIDYFHSKLDEIEIIIKFAQNTLKSDDNLRQIVASVLYSQLVTALEVYLREKFQQGMESNKAFNNFIKKHLWKRKYYPHEIYGNIKQLVNAEVSKLNFQSFGEIGRVYEDAFGVKIFGFPKSLKREISRILRYRHSLIHQDEIWEKGRFVKIDLPQLQSDVETAKDFVMNVQESFEENIGFASEIKMERVKIEMIKDYRAIDNCKKCPLGLKFNAKTIVCFEGAYDGIGFGMTASEWKDPACGGISFREAMRQRKILGEKALFGQINLIPIDKEGEKRKLPKDEKAANAKVSHDR